MKEYHHGDLANALLKSARAVLNDKGVNGLSLRAYASHAGVSHAAPAHHFKSLNGLLTELAIIGFNEFTVALQQRFKKVKNLEPRQRLQEIGQAYLDFSLKEPHLFELMFSSSSIDFENPQLQASANTAYDQLKGVVHPLFDQKNIEESQREQAEILVWSIIHGYSKLLSKSKHDDCNDEAGLQMPDIAILGKLLS